MQRFMGMMPVSEIALEKRFKVGFNQLNISIQVGEKGWTIIYADGSADYADIDSTVEENYNAVMKVVNERFSHVTEIV